MSARNIALIMAFAALAMPAAYASGEVDAKPAEHGVAPMPMPMPMDCTRMARHDHGADRGTPMPAMAMKCPMSGKEAAAPAGPANNAKAKRGHDHARVHKLM